MPGPRRYRDNNTGEEFTMDWYGSEPPTPDEVRLYRQQQNVPEERPWYSPSRAWDTVTHGVGDAVNALGNIHPIDALMGEEQKLKESASSLWDYTPKPIQQFGTSIGNVAKSAAHMIPPVTAHRYRPEDDPSLRITGHPDEVSQALGWQVSTPAQDIAAGMVETGQNAARYAGTALGNLSSTVSDLADRYLFAPGSEPYQPPIQHRPIASPLLHAAASIPELGGLATNTALTEAEQGNPWGAAGSLIGSGALLYGLGRMHAGGEGEMPRASWDTKGALPPGPPGAPPGAPPVKRGTNVDPFDMQSGWGEGGGPPPPPPPGGGVPPDIAPPVEAPVAEVPPVEPPVFPESLIRDEQFLPKAQRTPQPPVDLMESARLADEARMARESASVPDVAPPVQGPQTGQIGAMSNLWPEVDPAVLREEMNRPGPGDVTPPEPSIPEATPNLSPNERGMAGIDTRRPYDVWRQETIDMGFDAEHIDMAKKVADAFGEDITRSDDLYDFDHFMSDKYGDVYEKMVDAQVEHGVEPQSVRGAAPVPETGLMDLSDPNNIPPPPPPPPIEEGVPNIEPPQPPSNAEAFPEGLTRDKMDQITAEAIGRAKGVIPRNAPVPNLKTAKNVTPGLERALPEPAKALPEPAPITDINVRPLRKGKETPYGPVVTPEGTANLNALDYARTPAALPGETLFNYTKRLLKTNDNQFVKDVFNNDPQGWVDRFADAEKKRDAPKATVTEMPKSQAAAPEAKPAETRGIAEAPKAPKKPTPDRVLRIGRGQHDVVRTVFPDKAHADLFSGVGRTQKAMRGVKGIKANYESLAQHFGVSVQEVTQMASDYRAKVMREVKALPKTAPEGTDVLHYEAPTWDAKGEGPSIANEKARRATEFRNKTLRTLEKNLEKVPDVASDMAPRKGKGKPKVDPAQALADIFQKRAEEVGDKKWDSSIGKPKEGELPQSKRQRMQLIVDEFPSNKDMTELLKDKDALELRAHEGGVSPEALRQTFRRLLKEETGAIQLPSKAQLKKLARSSFDVMNQARMTSMLSGLAVHKSLAGNIGSHLIATLEHRTLEPLKVLTNVKAIASDLKTGWVHNTNPAMTAGIGKFNLPGRVMGAADYAATESLVRAGISRADAREIMLTNANAIAKWPPFKGRAGQFFIPFKTIPFNQLGQALTRWKKYPGVYTAAVVLGALSGAKVQDKEKLAILSAFAGPYAVPFLAGAAISGGARNLEGISPIPEWGLVKTLTKPQAAFTDSPARRWFRTNMGFGAQAAKEHKVEQGQSVGKMPGARIGRGVRRGH